MAIDIQCTYDEGWMTVDFSPVDSTPGDDNTPCSKDDCAALLERSSEDFKAQCEATETECNESPSSSSDLNKPISTFLKECIQRAVDMCVVTMSELFLDSCTKKLCRSEIDYSKIKFFRYGTLPDKVPYPYQKDMFKDQNGHLIPGNAKSCLNETKSEICNGHMDKIIKYVESSTLTPYLPYLPYSGGLERLCAKYVSTDNNCLGYDYPYCSLDDYRSPAWNPHCTAFYKCALEAAGMPASGKPNAYPNDTSMYWEPYCPSGFRAIDTRYSYMCNAVVVSSTFYGEYKCDTKTYCSQQ